MVRMFERFDLQIGIWVMSSIFLALISTFVCDMISVYAQGSGIPEVKTILSGINFYKYLSLRTLFAKFIGLVTIQSAGFLIGFQGPIIHCSAIIANNIMKLKYFKEFDDSNFIRRQLLTTSVACGVVSTFGTPYGGILFSVELCTSVYLISNLFKAFVCGTVAYLVYQEFHQYHGFFDDYLKELIVHKKVESMYQFVVLGLVCGYLGSFLIYVAGKLIELKNSSTFEFFKNRYLFTSFAAFFISVMCYFHPSFWFGNRKILIDLFNRENLISDQSSGIWNEGDPVTLLSVSIIIRFIVFLVMVNTPVPNGIFAPAVVIGGLIGRSYGEFCNTYMGISANNRMLAVSGAAAFGAVITKTTSPILILLEMTGDMEYLTGLLITVMVANSVAGVYTMNFFDTVLNIKKLPYLPVLYSSMWYKRIAAEVMDTNPPVITKCANLVDLLYILSCNTKIDRDSYIGVIESQENQVLVGSFKFGSAIDYLVAECAEIDEKLKTGTSQSDYRFQKFFQSLKADAGMEINPAGDSDVVEMGNVLMGYLNDMIKFETRYTYDKEGRIVEEKKLVGTNLPFDNDVNTKKSLDSIVAEIKAEDDRIKKMERGKRPTQLNPTRKVSKKSVRMNRDDYFIFFRQVIFKKEVRFDHPALQLNSFPTSVRVDTKLVKIHYLFQMLGTSCIYVRGDKEILKGFITKQSFLNLRYSLGTGN